MNENLVIDLELARQTNLNCAAIEAARLVGITKIHQTARLLGVTAQTVLNCRRRLREYQKQTG